MTTKLTDPGMTYIRAQSQQIDAWETLGNAGWNWNTLYPYYLKTEHFQRPTAAQFAAGASYISNDHGEHGPLDVGYPYGLHNGSLADMANVTWQNLGLPFNQDANSGDVRGFFVWPQTLDRAANARDDSARAYYYPVETRQNLVALRGVASRLIWADNEGSDQAIANGVEYISPDGTVQQITARKEVILSAGAIRSPSLLELSGVGNPRYGPSRSQKIIFTCIGS